MGRHGHVDNHPFARGTHCELVGGLAHREGSADVEPLHRVPALGCDLLGRYEVLAAGVVEQEVELAVTLERAPYDPLGLGRYPDVARDHRAALSDLRRGLLEDLLTPTRNHDPGAAAHQFSGGRLTEVGAAAGDQHDPAGQRAGREHARRFQRYSPITLITSRFGRRPSNSQ